MTSKGTEAGAVTQTGDLVRLEYDLWAETGEKTELLDTTHEETAQSAGASSPSGRAWGPQPHLIGGEFFPHGIESALVGIRLGEELEREFAPADAFGERDPNLIELFSMHEIERLPEMRRQDAHLDLGTILTINGRRGKVTTLTAARVRVDFNPPFAGRKVRGKFKIVEKIVEPADQARAIVELQYGHGSEFHVELREKTLTVKVPDRAKFDPAWIVAKARVIDRVRSQLGPETVRFVEEYVSPRETKSAQDAPGAPASEATAGAGASKPPRSAKASESAEEKGSRPTTPKRGTRAAAEDAPEGGSEERHSTPGSAAKDEGA